MLNTHKITIRQNAKSPKYGYGYHKLTDKNGVPTGNGYRIDVPYYSYTKWNPFDKPMVRENKRWFRNNRRFYRLFNLRGLRVIIENNRTRTTKVYRVSETVS